LFLGLAGFDVVNQEFPEALIAPRAAQSLFDVDIGSLVAFDDGGPWRR